MPPCNPLSFSLLFAFSFIRSRCSLFSLSLCRVLYFLALASVFLFLRFCLLFLVVFKPGSFVCFGFFLIWMYLSYFSLFYNYLLYIRFLFIYVSRILLLFSHLSLCHIYLLNICLPFIAAFWIFLISWTFLFSSHVYLHFSVSHMLLFLSIYPSHLSLSLASSSFLSISSTCELSFLLSLSPPQFSSWFHSRVGGSPSRLMTLIFPCVPPRVHLLQQNPRPSIYSHQNFTQTAYFTTIQPKSNPLRCLARSEIISFRFADT